MNTDLMLKVADAIEYADRFDLEVYFADVGKTYYDVDVQQLTPKRLYEDCNTVGCIAGWVAAYIEAPLVGWADTFDTARKALDLTYEEASELFTPPPSLNPDQQARNKASVWRMKDPYNATAKQAAKVLREIAAGKRKFAGSR